MTATISPLRSKDYYDQEEVKQSKTKKGRVDKENYYSENGNSLGFFYGDGSKVLGVFNQSVLSNDLRKLTEGINPRTGEVIFKKRKETVFKDEEKNKDKKLAKDGWDVCFSAPKDFTILSEFDSGNRETYDKIFNQALIRAVDKMNSKLYRRINSKGDKAHDVKPIQLVYEHKTSRPLENRRPDPQRHAHVITLKKCFDDEGKVRSIESFPMFQNQKMFGTMFRAELANGLREEFGFKIVPAKEEEINEDGTRGSNINSWKVQGITDTMRDTFSGRNKQINDLADELAGKKGTTKNNAMKQYISQNIKRSKEVWEEDKLKAVWQKDAQEVGLTKNYIESLKDTPLTNDHRAIVENMKLEETIIKQSMTKLKDGSYKLFESKLYLRLIENEQVTGINADERLQKLFDSGAIERVKGFELKCNLKLEKETYLNKAWKRNIKHDFKNARLKTYAYKSQYSNLPSSESIMINTLNILYPQLTPYRLFGDMAFMSMVLLEVFLDILKTKVDNRKEYIPKPKPKKKEKVDLKPIQNNTLKIGLSMGEIEEQLRKYDITPEEVAKLTKRLNELYAEVEQERLQQLNRRYRP